MICTRVESDKLFFIFHRTVENSADDCSYNHTDDERDDYQKNSFPEMEGKKDDIMLYKMHANHPIEKLLE
jgi:hypothetical protein